jgi:amidase
MTMRRDWIMGRLSLLALLSVCSWTSSSAQPTPPDPPDVHEASIPELADALAEGRITSVSLVDAYLARIAAYDKDGPALNAVIRLDPSARAQAAALDAERARRGPRGPLHGIPILVKDNYEVAGLTTSNGSIAFAAWVPERDAYVVRRLREAGAVILGMTNMHELASGITTIASVGGQTRNPYDPARNPGGSSGGTGAAIAASFAAIGWGSDTCGSIRIPASHQNLFGLRPTQGLFDATGIFPLSHSQDVPGPLARTVTDLAIGLDVTLPPNAELKAGRFRAALGAATMRGLRIGVLTNFFGTAPEETEVTRVLRPAIDSMKAHGGEVIEVTLRADLEALVGRGSLINHEHKWDMLDFLAERPAARVRSIAEILEQGLYHQALQNNLRGKDTMSARETPPSLRAKAARDTIRQVVLSALDEQRLDVLVYPTIRRKPALIVSLPRRLFCSAW